MILHHYVDKYLDKTLNIHDLGNQFFMQLALMILL